ncbi:MAG: cysteine peptidase family C39 domain-containing protein [Planctomycetota bacterium]
MKTKHLVLAIVSLLLLNSLAVADRPLQRAEILRILEKLTSQPRKAWIPAGTIEATHEEHREPKTTDPGQIGDQISQEVQEYKNNSNKRERTENLQRMKLDAIPFNVRYRLANEHTMNSDVITRFDGDRFYWEINVNSRADSVRPEAALRNNFMTDDFKLDYNSRRIFVWDGQKYTIYSLPANLALADSTGSLPHLVNGPLTAGLIPWGYGFYTYENLSGLVSSAVEKDADGQRQIHLTLTGSDGSQMLFVMDAGRDYAVVSHSKEGPYVDVSTQCDGYQKVAGSWVPTTISIERRDSKNNRLLGYDYWNFTNVSDDPPSPGSFDVGYRADALIEYRYNVTAKPVLYNYSRTADMDRLLTERLAFAASGGAQGGNCATAALTYAASQLGRDVTNRQLAGLMDRDGTSNLYAMKDLALNLGLNCRAVKTDIQTLKGLAGCKAILHLPGRNHFVVLDGVDDESVWSVDLTSNRFYYRTDLNFFDMDWTENTALLISDKPVLLSNNCTEIADTMLHDIVGGSGYSCTDLLQESDVTYCDSSFGYCNSYYEYYPERWGCEDAPSGSCWSSEKLRCAETGCIDDLYDPWGCDTSGEWDFYYMWACS